MRSQIPTLDVYARTWLPRVAPTLRPNSRRLYRYALEHHIVPALGSIRLDKLTRRDVRTLAGQLTARFAPKTVRGIIAALSALLSWAVEDGVITAYPALRLRLPREPRTRARAFTGEQLPLVLTACEQIQPRLAALYYLCAHVGLRVGEAQALRVGDADFTARTLAITRTAHRRGRTGPPKDGPRLVRLPPGLTTRLEIHERDLTGPWYFPARETDGPLSYTHVRRVFARACAAVGVEDRGTHALRRSHLSLLLAAGASPEFCRRQVGHASLAVTQSYNDELAMREPEAFLRF